MEHIKVSVIIPVYNTEDYVQQAILSIAQQTLREIEIIVINDGSTDGCLALIASLAGKDPRIHVFSQQNKGLSVTRNVGMKHALGKYVYFMDSDDLLEEDALQLCYEKCEAHELDFLFFDAQSFCDDEKAPPMTLTYSHTSNLDDRVWRGIDVLREQLQRRQFTPSACLSFIRREFMLEHKLRFYPGIVHEDQLFTPQLYMYAERAGFIRRAFFHRRMRDNSIMTTHFSWRNIEGYLTVLRELRLATRRQAPEVRAVIDQMLRQMFDAAVWQAHVLPPKQRLRLLAICWPRYRKYIQKKTYAALILKNVIK